MSSPSHPQAERRVRAGVVALLALALVACDKDPGASLSPASGTAAAARGPSDPTATWKLPLADGALALRSDGQFGDGTYSVYANGGCSVSTRIFATTHGAHSRHPTIHTHEATPAKCG